MKLFTFTCIVWCCLLWLGSDCRAQSDEDSYLATVQGKIDSCNGCGKPKGMPLLIYDASCRRFLFTEKDGKVKPLSNLEDFHIYYKKPFQLKIVNLNRYLYNVNLANSDVVFTSTQSEVMRQYLLGGSGSDTPNVPNTHADGASANQGDQIFGLIANFKPELDKMFVFLRGIPKSIQVISQLKSDAIVEFASLKQIAQTDSSLLQLKLLNNYNDQLDKISLKLSTTEKEIREADADAKAGIYKNKYIPTLAEFSGKAQGIINEIESKSGANYEKLKKDDNFDKFKASFNRFKSTVNALSDVGTGTSPIDNSAVPTATVESLKSYSDKLFGEFRALEKYYNEFIDEKIRVYSLRNQHFDCKVDESTLTYTYFNGLLSAINSAYADLREEAMRMPDPAATPVAPPLKPNPKPVPKAAPKLPDVMKVTAADFVFDKNGKITGIKLAQDGDAAKADPVSKKPDQKAEILAKIDSLGAQWFAFEKSVSPEFIMRRILFRRNIVAANMSYTSPPIHAYGDRMRLVFYIVASDSARKNGVILDDMTTESLDFRVCNKAQFSFSAGTFAGFGDNLRASTYEFRQVPATGSNVVESSSPYQLVNTGKGSIPIGAAALANLGFPITSGFHAGPSIGVGVTVSPDIKVGYLGGITASLGNYHQFHFSFGASAMTVNELKDNYKHSNALYAAVPAGSVYNQKVKPGFFFAFSYTVFNVKATSKSGDGTVNGTNIMVK